MKIGIYYEYGKTKEIGTGHKYRAMELTKELTRRGHKVEHTNEDVVMTHWDMLIIDHILPKKDMIERAKKCNMKTVLVDGDREDAKNVDLSVSAFFNPQAQYRGAKYMIFPNKILWSRYNPYNKNTAVFVAMGGFDFNNHASKVLDILDELGINAIVAKSINHPDFKQTYKRTVMYEGDDYYEVMNECKMAITNGGLSLFMCLKYGLPSIAIPQYEHQQWNINGIDICCVPSTPDPIELRDKIQQLWGNEYYRQSLSLLAQHFVDGKATQRVCDLINGL